MKLRVMRYVKESYDSQGDALMYFFFHIPTNERMKRNLNAIYATNTVLYQMAPEIPSSVVRTLLGVMIHTDDKGIGREDLTISRVAELVELRMPTVSRHIRYLGEFERPGVPGLNLVKTKESPLDRRQRIVSLTIKGIQQRNSMAGMVQQLLFPGENTAPETDEKMAKLGQAFGTGKVARAHRESEEDEHKT